MAQLRATKNPQNVLLDLNQGDAITREQIIIEADLSAFLYSDKDNKQDITSMIVLQSGKYNEPVHPKKSFTEDIEWKVVYNGTTIYKGRPFTLSVNIEETSTSSDYEEGEARDVYHLETFDNLELKKDQNNVLTYVGILDLTQKPGLYTIPSMSIKLPDKDIQGVIVEVYPISDKGKRVNKNLAKNEDVSINKKSKTLQWSFSKPKQTFPFGYSEGKSMRGLQYVVKLSYKDKEPTESYDPWGDLLDDEDNSQDVLVEPSTPVSPRKEVGKEFDFNHQEPSSVSGIEDHSSTESAFNDDWDDEDNFDDNAVDDFRNSAARMALGTTPSIDTESDIYDEDDDLGLDSNSYNPTKTHRKRTALSEIYIPGAPKSKVKKKSKGKKESTTAGKVRAVLAVVLLVFTLLVGYAAYGYVNINDELAPIRERNETFLEMAEQDLTSQERKELHDGVNANIEALNNIENSNNLISVLMKRDVINETERVKDTIEPLFQNQMNTSGEGDDTEATEDVETSDTETESESTETEEDEEATETEEDEEASE